MAEVKWGLRNHVRRVRNFVRNHIGDRVLVGLFDGTLLRGRILSAGNNSFRLRVRQRGLRVVVVIPFVRVRFIRLIERR